MDVNLSKLQEMVRTGKAGMLQSMGSQRVRHDWATKQQQSFNCNQWHIQNVKLFTSSFYLKISTSSLWGKTKALILSTRCCLTPTYLLSDILHNIHFSLCNTYNDYAFYLHMHSASSCTQKPLLISVSLQGYFYLPSFLLFQVNFDLVFRY